MIQKTPEKIKTDIENTEICSERCDEITGILSSSTGSCIIEKTKSDPLFLEGIYKFIYESADYIKDLSANLLMAYYLSFNLIGENWTDSDGAIRVVDNFVGETFANEAATADNLNTLLMISHVIERHGSIDGLGSYVPENYLPIIMSEIIRNHNFLGEDNPIFLSILGKTFQNFSSAFSFKEDNLLRKNPYFYTNLKINEESAEDFEKIRQLVGTITPIVIPLYLNEIWEALRLDIEYQNIGELLVQFFSEDSK